MLPGKEFFQKNPVAYPAVESLKKLGRWHALARATAKFLASVSQWCM
jgi:hypothetical protein